MSPGLDQHSARCCIPQSSSVRWEPLRLSLAQEKGSPARAWRLPGGTGPRRLACRVLLPAPPPHIAPRSSAGGGKNHQDLSFLCFVPRSSPAFSTSQKSPEMSLRLRGGWASGRPAARTCLARRPGPGRPCGTGARPSTARPPAPASPLCWTTEKRCSFLP